MHLSQRVLGKLQEEDRDEDIVDPTLWRALLASFQQTRTLYCTAYMPTPRWRQSLARAAAR
jgi:hypothetical protein